MCFADCKKPRADVSADPAAIAVPGWECSSDEDECKCTPISDAGMTPGKHPSCADGYTQCVASYGMSPTPLECVCLSGKLHQEKGGSWVRHFKLGDGDEAVSQCPPIGK